jgi:hypothetical protein
LVSFFEKLGADGLVGLFLVPRAATGSRETDHDLAESVEGIYGMDLSLGVRGGKVEGVFLD